VTLIHFERPRTGVAGVRSGSRGESRALPPSQLQILPISCKYRTGASQVGVQPRTVDYHYKVGRERIQRRAGSPTWRALSLRAV